MVDHVHMMISIPPKYAVSQVIGYIKGKSAIHLARVYGERRRNYVGQHFWARDYFLDRRAGQTVIRDYIKNQEKEDQRLDPDRRVKRTSRRQVKTYQAKERAAV